MGRNEQAVATVVRLEEVDRTQVALVGGKGANLGELSRVEGVRVPSGFCVTTNAFRQLLAGAPSIDDQLERMSRLDAGDRAAISRLSAQLRRTIAGISVPENVSGTIRSELCRLGEGGAYAVRSSATAEDLPSASFAGQHDSYLGVVGQAAVLEHLSRCWASLFTEQAVTYRLRNGIDHRAVQMAVVVQRMVAPHTAGVLFTADPVTGNRRTTSIEAVLGLGVALISGRVIPDVFGVRDGEVTAATLAAKQPTLTGAQVVELARLGRRVEAHFGHPQDVEWCLADDGFALVQSRPITALFPIPEAGDDESHVFLSVGHQQMMTDPMKPLGLSVHQLTAIPTMHEAGGRLFVDVARRLASPASRAATLKAAGTSDPLIGDALQTLVDRGDLVPPLPDADPAAPTGGAPARGELDPAVVPELVARSEASVAHLERTLRTTSGPAVFDAIRADIQDLQAALTAPASMQVIMGAMEAAWWLNEHLESWLGEKNAADALARSVPRNVTSEMGLALLDVADAIRPHPEVVAHLERTEGDDVPDGLVELAGGREAHDAIEAFLDKYGMRCVGEIDLTRPRWRERPSTLLPALLGHVKNAEPGAGPRRFEQGRKEASVKERELLKRVRALPDGERKADEVKRMIDRVRTFSGYREYPKYGIVSRYFLYKQALLEEAEQLARAGVLGAKEDCFYLTFDELEEAVRTHEADGRLIRGREEAFSSYSALTPPRVITSEGEVVTGQYRRDDVPPGALVGLPVSSGTVEGRARVVLDLEATDLEPGDILVTAFTDPSWTALFVAIDGLVTEVGGLMTHGAVIAREYGLPAVVGVKRATELIRDRQRIRVHGTTGFVELLS